MNRIRTNPSLQQQQQQGKRKHESCTYQPAACKHASSVAQVTGHKGAEEMGAALDGCDIVVIPAGVPRKPGMTR